MSHCKQLDQLLYLTAVGNPVPQDRSTEMCIAIWEIVPFLQLATNVTMIAMCSRKRGSRPDN